MSQLPTSQVGPLTGIGRPRTADSIPRQDIAALAIPGIEATNTIYDEGLRQFAMLQKALGLGGDLVEAAGNVARQERAENDRIELDAAALHRASAMQRADELAPTIIAEIRANRIIPGDLDPDEAARVLLAQYVPDDDNISPTYRTAFLDRATPRLVQAFADQRTTILRDVDREIVDRLGGAAAKATSREEFQASINEARRLIPNATTDEIDQRIVLTAAQTAAIEGDPHGMLDIALDFLGGRHPDKQAALRTQAVGVQRARANAAESHAINDLYALSNDGSPHGVILSRLAEHRASGAIPESRVDDLRRDFIRRGQAETERTIRTRILAGTITADEVRAETLRAAQFPADDVRHIDPATAQVLTNQARERDAENVALRHAVAVLSGGDGVLTKAHDNAIARIVGPSGAGFIDRANRVANPIGLTNAILQARQLPSEVRDTLLANLTSNVPAEIATAAEAVGALAVGDPGIFAAMLDAAGDTVDPILTQAAEEYRRGRLQEPSTREQAVQRIRAAASATQPAQRTPTAIIDDLQAGRPNWTLETEADSILAAIAAGHEHAKNRGLFGLDMLWRDPPRAMADHNVRQMVGRWFADRFERNRFQMSRGRALSAARDYAEAMTRNSVDFVRWNGLVTPVLIDDGQGTPLPEAFRWGQNFEQEAKFELEQAGFDPQEVEPRPFTSPQDGQVGWQFIDANGSPLVNDAGELIIYRPNEHTANFNAKDRRRFLKMIQTQKQLSEHHPEFRGQPGTMDFSAVKDWLNDPNWSQR